MPSKARHVQQALHNYAVYDYLNASPQATTDWQITVLFYAALHYVDAYLDNVGVHPRSHEDRDAYVSVLADLRHVARLTCNSGIGVWTRAISGETYHPG